ncbi:MAG: hypothetical protein IJH52_08585 [Oscillospiraceae bacterium]|nr:hypothetical protein [Oscillospiraceae bacterium]MBQ6404144.1 hypothetical protein [Oscillospiraceae bacterium]
MELQLEQQQIPCLTPCAQRSMEERFSTDAVVPDSLPDAAQLLLAEGDLCLWRLDLSDGSAELEGEIDARVCCVDDNGAWMSIPVRVPVQLRLRAESIETGQRPFLQCRIKKLSGQLLNSRKVRVQAMVQCSLVTYGSSELTVTTGISDKEAGIYQRKTKLVLPYFSAVEEQVVTAEETVPLQCGMPSDGRLLSFSSVPIADVCECADQRVAVKGRIRTILFYQNTAEKEFITEIAETPFSCVLDVNGDVSKCKLSMHLTSGEVRCRNDEPAVETVYHLLIQAVCFAQREIEYVTDAYSNTAELSLNWKEQSFSDFITEEAEQILLEGEIPCDITEKDVIAVRSSSQGDGVAVTMLLLDPQQSVSAESCFLKSDHTIVQFEEPSVQPGKQGVLIRVPALIMKEMERTGSMKVLSSAVLSDKKQVPLSGVTLVRRGEDTDLWELAKMNQSSVEAIRSANPDRDEQYKWFVIPHVS